MPKFQVLLLKENQEIRIKEITKILTNCHFQPKIKVII